MDIRKGIILTGGTGTRTAPFNQMFNKHLLPLYNKFIIDFPLDTLKQAGVQELTVILGGEHQDQIKRYFQINNNCGFEKINYVTQDKPLGIAHAISLCQEHIGDDRFLTCLGDNIFEKNIKFNNTQSKAQIVLCQHPEINRFGVASIQSGKIVQIVEKPKKINDSCDSNFAITGLYLFDKQYFEYFKTLDLSPRGEFEIVDIINLYRQDDDLCYVVTDGWWSDAGTLESIHDVSNKVRKRLIKDKSIF